MWPYSYSTCDAAAGGKNSGWSKLDPQAISACPDPPGFDRKLYGMAPGVGGGAPEIDLFEAK